jgi:hypothetical protein
MKQNKLTQILILNSFIFLSSCGGSGDNNASGSVSNRLNAKKLNINDSPTVGSVSEDQSRYYYFEGIESSTYQVTLISSVGDADVAVANNDEISDESVMVISLNEFSEDIVKFTAPNSQYYYVEVAGFVDSNYSIEVTEVSDAEIGFSFSQNLIDFISVRNKELPSPASLDINFTDFTLQIRDTAVSDDTIPPWMEYQLNGDSFQSESIYFNITSNIEPIGIYSTSVRVYADNTGIFPAPYPSVSVYKDITITYSLLNLIADSEIAYGNNQEFQIEVPSVPDSGIDVSLLSAPATMSLDASGSISWLPIGLMFDTSQSVNWTLRINKGLSTYDLTSTTLVNDASRNRPLFRSPISTPKWPSNVDIADFDGDGIKELLLTDNRKQVFTLEYVNNAFQYDWSLPFSLAEWESSANQDPNVKTLTSADLNSDGNPDIIIGYTSKIVVLDGVTKRQIASFEDGYVYRRDMLAARLTNTSTVTLVYLAKDSIVSQPNNPMSIVAYELSDLNNPSLVWRSEPLSFIDDYGDHAYLDIDNVDLDDNLEIISASGEIIDGQTFLIQDSFPIVAGEDEISQINAADVNNDGTKDVVICCKHVPFNTSTLLGYSTIDHSIIWESLPIEPVLSGSSTKVTAITVNNIDDLQEEEILVHANGRIYVYSQDSTTGLPTLTWEQELINSAHTLLVENIDEDPADELITLDGSAEFLPNFIVYEVADSSLTHQWELPTTEFEGSYVGGMWTNVNPDNSIAMFVNSNDGARTMNLVGMDRAGVITFRNIDANVFFTAQSYIAKTDYDNDSIEEILLSRSDGYQGFLSAIDFEADTVEWQTPTPMEDSLVVKYADMNGDTFDDLVTIQFPGNSFYIFDVYNNSEISKYDLGGIYDFEIVETNNSDVLNIVFLGDGLQIYKYVRSTNQLTELRSSALDSGDRNYSSGDFLVADVNGDDEYEIIMRRGANFRIKDFELNTLNEYAIDTTWLSGRMYTENGKRSSKNLLITINTGDEMKCCYFSSPVFTSFVRLIDAMTGKLIWESPALIGSAQNDSLNVIDSNIDGIPDFITLGTTEGMYITR